MSKQSNSKRTTFENFKGEGWDILMQAIPQLGERKRMYLDSKDIVEYFKEDDECLYVRTLTRKNEIGVVALFNVKLKPYNH
jgi:hypothetical protein